ncbi:SDR family oxidoreductase [Patescibacteria group bacterium]
MDIKGKIAVVTGAGGGLGSVLVRALEKEGVTCLLIERKLDLLERFKDLLDGERSFAFECDFAKSSQLDELVKEINLKFEKIDFLYNIAGVGIYKNIEELEISEWRDSLNINLTSAFILTKGLLPSLKRSEAGMVFNFGSGMGVKPKAGRVAYCASKFALRGMSLTLAEEFKGRGVDFIHLALGSVMTDFGTGGIQVRKSMEGIGKHYLETENVIKKVMEITKSEDREAEYILYPKGYEES